MFQVGGTEFRVADIRTGSNPKITIEKFEGIDSIKKVELGNLGGYIGRDTKNEIALPKDQQVSSKHAHIWFSGGEFYISDEGSMNKTWIRLSAEGSKSKAFPVANGDIAKVGASIFLIQIKDNKLNEQSNKIYSPPSCMETPKGEGVTKGGPNENALEIVLCKVCKKTEANGVFIPCGHNCTCYICAKTCTQCPKCTKEVFGAFKISKH